MIPDIERVDIVGGIAALWAGRVLVREALPYWLKVWRFTKRMITGDVRATVAALDDRVTIIETRLEERA